MQRTVITPADLSGDALDELKGWLGISRSEEDALLVGLLGASVALCEAFIGQAPLEQAIEEMIPAKRGAYPLRTHPIQALVSVELVPDEGPRTEVEATAYTFETDATLTGCIKLPSDLDGNRLAVTARAGLVVDWANLPHPLKHGMIRLAAFHYRDRDADSEIAPPASVAALWRPWRIARLV